MVERTGAITRTAVSGPSPARDAVAAFHGADGDGRLGVWPIGLPREAYGVSNDARGRFGPAVELRARGTRRAIRLR